MSLFQTLDPTAEESERLTAIEKGADAARKMLEHFGNLSQDLLDGVLKRNGLATACTTLQGRTAEGGLVFVIYGRGRANPLRRRRRRGLSRRSLRRLAA